MNAKYLQGRQVLVFALLISITMLALIPGNTIHAEAQAATLALPGFVKVSPADGATNQSTSVTLKWSSAPANPYGYGRYYKYCYYTSGGTCSYTGGLYTTQFNLTGLAQGTTYYWQIQVVYCKDASCGQKEKHEADNGTVWSFKTGGTQPPASFAKLSPVNNTTSLTNTTLSWASSQGATSYQYCFSLSPNDNNCVHLNGWRDVGNVTSFTIPRDPKFIWGNTYYWQIRASNAGGTKLANDGAWWVFTTANLIGKTTLISPSGAVSDTTPTYRWNHVTGVTWYYLWIINPTANIFHQWYDANAICSGGTCEVTPPLTLSTGNFAWWVQTWNSSGYGPWSDGLPFNIPATPVPGDATLISPNGSINDTTPTYTWNSVSGATWYYLWISKVNSDSSLTTVHKQWYDASLVCSGGNCSVTPAGITLASGNYRWWIQTWNAGGYGPWSNFRNFSLP
ncbi:MAG TPA: hypothetical protein VJ821_09305 [Anaerolineales bacterium]|nr:hypothetical protein [Anaerolineales bacterium]